MNGQTTTFLNDFAIENDIKLNKIIRMKEYNNEYGYFILNLDYETNGTHWVALFHTLNDKYKECYYYMDSFGYPPPEEFKKIIGNIQCFYSNVELQSLNKSDNNCGIWCLIFLSLIGFFNKISLNDFNNIIKYMKDVDIKWI